MLACSVYSTAACKLTISLFAVAALVLLLMLHCRTMASVQVLDRRYFEQNHIICFVTDHSLDGCSNMQHCYGHSRPD